ncbi:MAG: hypothetical protein KDD55_08950, partial [Bdellovibrionales bacterium]|nr:hypothetical protein [Bdellovibrionales bacterium]
MKSLCPPFLVVSGPTASGKSSLSVMLARYFSREVINVDSVQIYRGLEVGSAQISPEDQQGVRHHLIGELEINVPIDAKWYCDQIMSMTNSLQAEGKGSVLCVGTNLYLLSLLYGLAELPQGDGELRNQLEQESTVVLYERLKECDPRASENIHPHDKVRIIRALEVAHLSQDSLSEAHHIHQATLDP